VPLKILLGLILGNMIWSAHPAMGKLVLEDFSPAEGAWLRYTTALISFFVFRAFFPVLRAKPVFFAKNLREWMTVIAMGGATFCFSPLLQLTGLQASRATDNALIISMEPMMTVFLAWIFLREKITASYLATFVLALFGFALLAGVSWRGLEVSRAHLIGNFIMLISLLGEAYYSVGGSKLLDSRSKNSPFSVYALAIISGVVLLTISVAIFTGEGPLALIQVAFHKMTWHSGLAIAWLGPLGTSASYLYWMYALKEAPVASIALTLFVQPVFGSFWGYLFLGERLTGSQAFGGVLIIMAVFAQTLGSIRRTSNARQGP
jgi:drug/metabolite transporter (DMT)-like permease